MDKKIRKDDTAALTAGFIRNRDRVLNVAYLVQLGIGIEDTIENFILKSSDVRFKSHGVGELKNLRYLL